MNDLSLRIDSQLFAKSQNGKTRDSLSFRCDSHFTTPPQSQLDPYAFCYCTTTSTATSTEITVETNDVHLDLNGYSLSMSEYFYHQQRWFKTIELSTYYFLPGHGNYNISKNIKVTRLVINNFETHGIQLNGFDNIVLYTIDIDPTSSEVCFNGEYGQKVLLTRKNKQMAKELLENEELDDEDKYIEFYGRDEASALQEITDKWELEMIKTFDYIVNDISYDDSNNADDDTYNSFVSAKKLFINDKMIMYKMLVFNMVYFQIRLVHLYLHIII